MSSRRLRETLTLAWGSHSDLGLTCLQYQRMVFLPLMAASTLMATLMRAPTILIDQGSL